MNRLLGLFIALALGFWAQRTLTGPEPGIPRDALILFVLASVVFLWNARPPEPLRQQGTVARRRWHPLGLALSLAGLAGGLISLVFLWMDLHSLTGLLLWPVATVLFVVGAFIEQDQAARNDQRGLEFEWGEGGGEWEHGAWSNQQPGDPGQGRVEDGANPEAQDLPPRKARDAVRGTLTSWLGRHWDILALILILVAAAFVRFYQLGIYPNGCQSDECNNGLDALKWLAGAPYQPYAETNEGQATLFTYLIALSFKLFGVGVMQMRMVSAFVGVLTVLAFYLLARDLYGRRPGLAAAALLATARWHVTFSRIVYELIMQPLFMALLFLFLLRGLRAGRRRDWALAGLCLAVGLNTYTAFRVVPFLVAAFLLFWIVRDLLTRRESVRHDPSTRSGQVLEGAAILAGAAFTAVLPLGVYVVQNWNVFTSRMRHISVMRDVERVGSTQPIIDNLRKTLYMFNWQGDLAALNNLPGAPMLDTFVAVLFVLGLAYSIWHALRGRALPVLYVFWFVAIVSLGVLSVAHEAPTARRTIGTIPLIYLLAALVLDQFFLAWRRAWRGLGERWFGLAVGVTVAVVALANARIYFTVQAPHPDVWNAYSPGESAVGRFLTTLDPQDTVLITPQYEHHSAIKLIGRNHPYRALNPVDDLPYRGQTNGDLIYLLEPVDRPLFSLLEQVYPGGEGMIHRDRTGRSHFIAYRVPREELSRTQGIVGQFYRSYPPTQAPEARLPVRELNQDLAQAPLAPPFFAVWEGTLLVPEFGQYTFDLLAEGEAASLQIGRQLRLGLPEGGQDSLTATLPAGFHPLRLEYRSGEAPGRLWLLWSGPGFTEQVVGGDALYAFNLGGQGLVGYYYPNGAWQGPPALVRNDLLIVPNNPLREPFSIRWLGKIAIPQEGTYTFGTRSDDGSFLFIDGQLVVDNGGSHGAQDRQGSIHLSQGFHDIEVRYNELGGSRAMELWWIPPGQGRAIVDSAYLFPLSGEELPEGLALPPLPQIPQPAQEPEIGAGEVAAPEIEPPSPPAAGAAPPVRLPGDFPQLTAELAWEYGSCGPQERDGQFNSPRGVAIDPATAAVYVADAGAARIVKLDDDGEFDLAWGEAGEGPAQFQEPFDLVVELAQHPGANAERADGTVLVLDAVAQRLLRFSPEGDILATFGAEYTFYRPRGLGSDAAGQLAVADTGGVRIVLLDAAGVLLGEVGGRESDLARQQPTDAALSPAGDLYFVEAESGVITRLADSGGLSRWQGPLPASTIDGPHLAWSPRPAGGLYVTDPEGRRVLLFDPAGEPLGQFGAEVGLVKPVGIAAAPAGDGSDLVVVVDSQACRVVALRVAAP